MQWMVTDGDVLQTRFRLHSMLEFCCSYPVTAQSSRATHGITRVAALMMGFVCSFVVMYSEESRDAGLWNLGKEAAPSAK
jgi:hypothetical protein